jgi:hypothetical protein
MIKQQSTRIRNSLHRDVALGYDIKNEGVALVYVLENGVGKVKPAGGISGEKFAGISLSQTQVPDSIARIDSFTLAGDASVTLNRGNVISGQILVLLDGTKLTATTGSVDAGKYKITLLTGVIELNTSDTGSPSNTKTLSVQYRYTPTVTEAIQIQGNGPVGGVTGASSLGVVGVIVDGDVATDQYDSSDNWAAGGPIYLGGSGMFTLKSGGTELKNANILSIPALGSAFLTIGFGPYSG